MGYFKFNLICLLIVLTINLNYAAEGKDEKFPNFYAAPANLELIAMDSQRSTNQQSGKPNNSSPSSIESSGESTLVASSLSATSSSSSKSSSKSSSSSEEDDSGEPRFSIGLGTLAPSYSQKFGLDGNTRLDFDHHNNGFSYTLTNHHHPQPNSFSDLSKDEFFGQPSNQQFSQSEHSSKPNIKIYYNQRYHSIPSPPPPPSSPLSSTAESKNFFSALPPSPRSFDFSPSTRSKSNKIPDESRFRELVDKYAPKEEEDSLESFFKKDLTPKGSWNSLSDRPSFDHMPHDMPDEMPEHHQPHPHHHYDSEPQTSTPPPPQHHPQHHSHHHPQHHPQNHQSHHQSHSHPRPHPHHSEPRYRSHSASDSPRNGRSHNLDNHQQHHPHHSHSHPPPPPPPPPPHHNHHHHSSPDHSGEPPREKYYDDSRGGYEESPRSSNEYSGFNPPSPYIGSGSDLEDEDVPQHHHHRHEPIIGSSDISGPIQFNSQISHGSDALNFQKDNTIITGSPGARGFEYINRITSNSHEEIDPFQFNAASFEPVVFSSNIAERFAGFEDNPHHHGFSTYIAGLPFAP